MAVALRPIAVAPEPFLQSELESVQERLRTTEERIARLDAERAQVMELLDQSMALDTFRKAEAELTGLDATIADLEQRLQQAEALTEGDLKRKAMALSAQTALRTEYAETGYVYQSENRNIECIAETNKACSLA